MEGENSKSSGTDSENSNFLGFEINTTPSGIENYIIPEYDNKRKYKLDADGVKEIDENGREAKRKKLGGNSCWNCGESGHTNIKCREPFNARNMHRNKQQFMKNKPRLVYKRYFLEKEQKFDHLKPGTISEMLRKALQLNDSQLPRFIYNMRRLGYPQGWFEEAKVVHSGMTLFDCRGNVVDDPDGEEGEVIDSEMYNKYDFSKIIKYPGFNVPPPHGTIDEADKYNCPPMSEDQSLENLVASLKPNEAKAYTRQKVPILPSATPPRLEDSENNSGIDMEYEETPEIRLLPDDGCGFVPPLPDDELPPPPPEDIPEPPPLNSSQLSKDSLEETSSLDKEVISSNNITNVCSIEVNDSLSQLSSNSTSGRSSPSISVLEEQKSLILSELNNSNSSESRNERDIVSPTINGVSETKHSSPTTPNIGKIKAVNFGTPILKSVSPFSKLPKPESFSKNICDVINFENLPDSTGHYNRMVGILQKARSTLKRIQSSVNS